MKKYFLIIMMSSFILTIFSVSACSGDTCEKALTKAQACYKKDHKKAKSKNTVKARFLDICKSNTSKFKKCLKIKDCVKYRECISKAGSDPKAVQALQKTRLEEQQIEEPVAKSETKPTTKPETKPATSMKK